MTVPHPFDGPHARRAEAVRRAAEALGADAGHHHMLVRGSDQLLRFHGVAGIDTTEAAAARWRETEGLPALLGDADPDHVPPLNVLGVPPDDLYHDPAWRYGFGDLGYRRLLYASVTEGADLRGQISLLRADADPWAPGATALEAASVGLRTAFREAWDEERALAPPEGVVAIRPDGAVVAEGEVAAWIDRWDAGPWLRARAADECRRRGAARSRGDRAWVPGAFAQWRRIPGGGVLVTLEPVVAMELPPILLRLTPMQRRVASLAAAGATAVEIAAELGRSPDTVREHLSRIYQRLGVASRSELATTCRRMLI